ncbi:MoaD/ThiS family protein [Pseudarthrobacter oxydans]|uniref:MoaD/ThiS family protein n=1 Tax=Pseudarthrobacter oxydans TaxID=1671 RepID=UPI003450DC92
MNIRYFAAARAAAGIEEEKFDLTEGTTVAGLLEVIRSVKRPEPPAGTPPLANILARSSLLLNEVAVRDHSTVVRPNDVVDVLPPFAGG